MKPLSKLSSYNTYWFFLLHYLLGLLFFTGFRMILFLLSNEKLNSELAFEAFKIGFQYDSVILGYILSLPVVVILTNAYTQNNRVVYKIIRIYIVVLMSIALIISCIDIPYFLYNSSRLTSIIFNWFSSFDIVATMIAQEPSYLMFSFLFMGCLISFSWMSKKIAQYTLEKASSLKPNFKNISLSILFILATFLCVRGRINSPIKVHHAFFCNNSTYNQLGLNPSFTFIISLKEKKHLSVYDQEEALSYVQKQLKSDKNAYSPISRKVIATEPLITKNVVLVIMESMSADKLGVFGNPKGLTPFLDSLSKKSIHFSNIYSAGKHTYNGIFSSLYGYPAILRKHTMSTIKINEFTGLPGVLKQKNYETVYFTTHSETFDNVGVFLPYNHFNQVVSQKKYDPKHIQSAFGVPDHILFDYAIEKIDTLSHTTHPFFATLMTVSDHGPYIIPKNISFIPKNKDIKDQVVEYADWSLRSFFQQAKTKKWFNNTIFVFVADHGCVMGESSFSTPLSFNHVPLLIYSADTTFIHPQTIENFGCQIDIFPTVMGLLNSSYTNNTLGVDLLKEKRPYAYFSVDDKIGCIDANYLYVYDIMGSEYLYNYSSSSENIFESNKDIAEKMKRYALSMTQTADWLVITNKTGFEK